MRQRFKGQGLLLYCELGDQIVLVALRVEGIEGLRVLVMDGAPYVHDLAHIPVVQEVIIRDA